MPLFYLHVCDGTGFVEDEEGLELPDEAAARDAAVRGARDLMSAEVGRGELDLSSFIEVEDENHQWLFTLTFAEAVRLKNERQASPSGRPGRRTDH